MMDVGWSDVGKREAGVRGMEGGCGVRCAGRGVWLGVRGCVVVGLWLGTFFSVSDDSGDSGNDGQERPGRRASSRASCSE